MNWPPNKKPARFAELVQPTIRAIKFAYELKRKNKDQDIPWTGLPKGRPELVSTLPPEQALSREYLEYSLREQGREPLMEILAIMAQVCFEQERRVSLQNIETALKMIELKTGSAEYTRLIREYLT
jgi:hypothetical protein